MPQRTFNLFLLFLLLLFSTYCLGQSSAVRMSINILPPYSVYLSDYVAPASNKLIVNINVTDPNPDDLTAKLKITIEGEGITIVTRPDFMPSPLRLIGGTNPITTADLAPYFDPANLNFQGIDKSQFIRSGRLKEGIYQFCVEAVEYNRNVKLSDKSCATAWLLLNNPPQWNLPQAGELIKASNPQNMLFNWIPQHTGSPNAAFTTEYEFTLVEIWPENRNPNDAINSQLPLYKTTTSATTLIYGPAEPPLIPGHKYAVRLRAYDKEGRDLFINNGYSEVRTFTFGEACLPPNVEKASIENFQKARIQWSGHTTHTDYTVRYRPYSKNTDLPWYYKNALLSYVHLDTLNANTEYEYSVKANCGSITSEYSLPNIFKLPPVPENNFECKDEVYVAPLSNAGAKKELRLGEKVNIGGYAMEITEVKNDLGLWTGKGIITVPFLNNIRLATHFTQIRVNENNEVTAGQVYTERATLNATDAQTKARITEMLNDVDKGFTVTEQYIENANNIIKETNNIIRQVPEQSKQLLEQGRDAIEKGKQLIASGDSEGGKALIEKGKAIIKQATTELRNTLNQGIEGIDKLKELFIKAIALKRKDLEKDSVELNKGFKKTTSELESYRASYEGELYEPIINSEVTYETTEENTNTTYEISEAAEINKTLKTPLLSKLSNSSEQKIQIENKTLLNQKSLEWLFNLANTKVGNLDDLIKSFLNDGLSTMKKYAFDKLTQSQTEELDKVISNFIQKKLDEVLLTH